jgi:hypothetical protein
MRRWECNIEINFQKIVLGSFDRIVAQYRDKWRALVNTIMNLVVP